MSLNRFGLLREKVMVSWLKTFKQIFNTEERGGETKLLEKITGEQLSVRLDQTLAENLEKKEKFKQELSALIQQFGIDLQEILPDLENVNVEEKREHEKVKLIVRENLKLYIAQLKQLATQLRERNNLHGLTAQEYHNKILNCIDEFDRRSHLPFEKATLLVGKELGAAKTAITNLIREINNTAHTSRAVFEESELISQLAALLPKLKSNELSIGDLDRRIIELREGLAQAKETGEAMQKEIEKIKAGEEYRQDLQAQEEHQQQLRTLDRELHEARQQINLKFMAKHFHHDPEKSQLIKAYSENFQAALENDQNLAIIGLVKDSQNIDLNSGNSWKGLPAKVSELNKPFLTKTGQEIAQLEDKVTALAAKIVSIEANIIQETKKKEKLAKKEEEILREVNRLSRPLFSTITEDANNHTKIVASSEYSK